MKRMQFKIELRAQNIIAEHTCGARFIERLFKAVVHLKDFAVNIVIANRDPHRVGRNRHALNHDMGVQAQNIAIFKRTRFAFVRIAN